MQTVNVTIRCDKETGRPVLFFWNSNSLGWEWLECYDRIGQHSQASIDYMRQGCTPMRELDGPALALLHEWSTMGEPVNARPVARLQRPRCQGAAPCSH